MIHAMSGRAHAALSSARTALDREHGQGTVEYVGLILLMAVVLAALVAAAHDFTGDGDLTKTIVDKLKGAVDGVKDSKAK